MSDPNPASMPDAPWPAPVRRTITSHPTSSTGSTVLQTTSLVPLRPVLDSQAAITPLHSTIGCPTTSSPHFSTSDMQEAIDRVPGVVFPGGVNCQVTDLKPGFRVGMHRTNSVDYNIMTHGSCWHITPNEAGGEDRVLVGVGEVVVQRGTLHAWEAGPEGARWICVVVAAEPVEIGGKKLEEVAF